LKIKLSSLDPKVAELIESNNQHETLLNVLSVKISKIEKELQILKEENQRKRSMEF